MNIMKEPSSYLPVALSHVSKDNQILLKGGKNECPLSFNGLDEVQAQEALLLQHGEVEERDHHTVGDQGGQQRLPEEAGGVDSQKAG